MKFEISDDAMLKVSGIATSVYAVHLFGFPRHAHDVFYDKGVTEAETKGHETTARWFGYALGGMAVQNLCVGMSENSKEAKKNMLKANGGAWLVGSALHLYNASEGVQKQEVAYTCAALGAVMGALCLWRGFDKEEKEEKEV